MFNKIGMRPAFATANSAEYSVAKKSKVNDSIAFSGANYESDDFNTFSSKPEKQYTPKVPKQPKSKGKGKSSFSLRKIPFKAILAAVAALVGIFLLIILAVVIFSAPKKEIRIKDNAYIAYTDSDNKGHVVSDGKLIEHEFNGEVSIQAAKDNSFAYVFESIPSGESVKVNIYILKGKKLDQIITNADCIPTVLADFEPGIVYTSDKKYFYYSSSSQMLIPTETSTENPEDTFASNFVISGDASTVVFTQKKGESLILKHFKDSLTKDLAKNLTPQAISMNGEYIYCTTPNGNSEKLICTKVLKKANDSGSYIETSKIAENFISITGMNTTGKEIIFSANTASKGIVSYHYNASTKAQPTALAEGLFIPVNIDPEIVCPSTFVNSYFLCEKSAPTEEEPDKTVVSTYFFSKKDGVKKIANTAGKFSIDEEYFYYIDENANLIRVSLSSKEFEDKDKLTVYTNASSFELTKKGDIYIKVAQNNPDKCFIAFKDASSGESKIISDNADNNILKTMQICSNSIYFSETTENGTTVYVSTSGSAKEVAKFKSSNGASEPIFITNATDSAYAYVSDESGNIRLYYTSNGKKFSLVTENCDTTYTDSTETEQQETETKTAN